MAPGPGNYNPIDNSVWNKMARDANEKKSQIGGTSKGKEGDKKGQNERKKLDKPFPGPGS